MDREFKSKMDEGGRLEAAGKWTEARAEYQAAQVLKQPDNALKDMKNNAGKENPALAQKVDRLVKQAAASLENIKKYLQNFKSNYETKYLK